MLGVLENSYNSLSQPESVLVGLSGGADSVALLVCLCELRKTKGFSLHAVHVNHGLRTAAAQDEAYCIQLCERLNVPLVRETVSISGTGNIEARAREARYAAFGRAMSASKCRVIALAHHMDDQAETLLLHLLYGTGSTGLGGMKEKNGSVWRPFLKIRRSQLQNFLSANGFEWREDESNCDPAFTRNRIRATVLPSIEACSPDAVQGMSRTADILQAEDEYLALQAESWLKKYASDSRYAFLMTEPLAHEHPAMQRRIIRRYAQHLSLSLDFIQTERVREMIQSENAGTTDNLPGGWQVFRSRERLHFLHPEKINRFIPGEFQIGEEIPNDARHSHLIPLKEACGLTLRTRRTGDVIQPFGMQGKKPLKEYMIDRSIDKPFRDGWPLVCRGNEVLWVIGVGASEKLRVKETEDQVKHLIYLGKLPDEIQKGDWTWKTK